ncbi:MAG: PilZ domain-containing protein [Blastocatellia bacterium]|nr:PilZ domain-containing protein [Blastocatellia bacterium]
MEQARVHLDIPVLIKGKNAQGKAFAERTIAENMTRRGVFIRTTQPFEIGQILRIYPADDGSRAIARVEVVWHRPEDSTESPGVGAKLLGNNRHWVNFLVDNSLPVDAADEHEKDESDDDDLEAEYGGG